MIYKFDIDRDRIEGDHALLEMEGIVRSVKYHLETCSSSAAPTNGKDFVFDPLHYCADRAEGQRAGIRQRRWPVGGYRKSSPRCGVLLEAGG